MTRIKTISVMAVALALTALSASGAHARESFAVSTTCPVAFTFPTGAGPNPASAGSTLTWTFHNPNASPASLSFVWKVLEDNSQGGSASAPANGDVSIATTLVSPKATLVLASVAGGFPPTPCPLGKAVFPAESTPAPSETASPTATPSPTASPTTAPTETAQPTASTATGASSAPPSPPATGFGSRGSGDNSFVLLLLALVLGTVVVGGTTLALSRKRV